MDKTVRAVLKWCTHRPGIVGNDPGVYNGIEKRRHLQRLAYRTGQKRPENPL